MLQTLRKGAAGWVAKIFLGVLVLSFAVWGIADIFRVGGTGTAAATVGTQEVPLETFRQAYANEIRRVSQQAKRPITPEQARIAGLGERTLGNLVNELALDTRVASLGLAVSDEEVGREITEDDVFKGPDGRFDRAGFQEILRQNNLNENAYITMQRQFTARRQLTDALAGEVPTPLAFREALHGYVSDSRSISYVTLTPEAPSAVPAPADAALRSYFEERKASFAAPEFRKVALLQLDPAKLAATRTVPEQDIRAYYDANKPKYATAEKRSIEQVTYPSLDEAKAGYARIQAGGLFEQEMARQKITPQDAFLGNLTKAEMFDAKIADAAFALAPNTVSQPIQGAYTTALLRVTGVQQEQTKSFEQVKGEIRKVIAEEGARADLQGLHDKVDEARLGGSTLDEIVKSQKLPPLKLVDAIDAQGRGPDGKPAPGVPASESLMGAIFAATPGAENDPVTVDGGYVWYEVREVKPARDRTFEEARADVEARWRADEARKRLDARADALLGQLKAGKPFDQTAAAEKLELAQAETTRVGGAPDITQAQAVAVFQTPVDGFGKTAPNDQGARLVFKVTAENTRPFDPNAPDGTGQVAKISESLSAEVVSAFVRQIRDQLGVKFNEPAIAQVLGGGEG